MSIGTLAVIVSIGLILVYQRALFGARGRRRVFGWLGRVPSLVITALMPTRMRRDQEDALEERLNYLNDPLRGAPWRFRWLQGAGLILGVLMACTLAFWMSEGRTHVPTALFGLASSAPAAATPNPDGTPGVAAPNTDYGEPAPTDFVVEVGIGLAILLGFIGWRYPYLALRARVTRRKQRLLLQLADLLELMAITMRAGAEFDQSLEAAGRTIYDRFLQKPDQYPLGIELAQALFERNMGVSRADFMASLGLRATMRKERDENEFSDAAVTLWDELTQAVTLSQEVGSSLRETLPEIVERVRNGRLKAAEQAAASARVTIIYPQGLLVLTLMLALLVSVGLLVSNLALAP